MSKQTLFLFGFLLLLSVCFLPVGCQYTLAQGPDWLVARSPFAGMRNADGDEVIVTAAAVKFTTFLLMVLLTGFGAACLFDSVTKDK
jgi:hypothetical protein